MSTMWIESHGATRTYRIFRQLWRAHYHTHYPLVPAAAEAEYLNPGACLVSRLCAESAAALIVLESMLARYTMSDQLRILYHASPTAVEVEGDRVLTVQLQTPRGLVVLKAPMFLDATEEGALLPLADVEHVSGAELDTGELHASPNPSPGNRQSATWCFAIEYREGEDHTITRPDDYAFGASYVPSLSPPWPGKLFSLTYTHPITLAPRQASFDPRPEAKTAHFNLWNYRRLISPANFAPGRFSGGISLVNWP